MGRLQGCCPQGGLPTLGMFVTVARLSLWHVCHCGTFVTVVLHNELKGSGQWVPSGLEDGRQAVWSHLMIWIMDVTWPGYVSPPGVIGRLSGGLVFVTRRTDVYLGIDAGLQSSKLSSQARDNENGIIFSWLDLYAADNFRGPVKVSLFCIFTVCILSSRPPSIKIFLAENTIDPTKPFKIPRCQDANACLGSIVVLGGGIWLGDMRAICGSYNQLDVCTNFGVEVLGKGQ